LVKEDVAMTGDGLLTGKAALVTGAAGGLGRAIAHVFAREGAQLFLVDRRTEDLAETQVQVERLAAQCHVLTTDLAVRENCFNAIDAAAVAFGRLDVLCNNAAILSFDHVEDVSDDVWGKTLAINLTAPFYLSQAAIPHLKRASGNIVNVASSGGLIGTAYTVPYSTAKAGLIHMTKCMAMEFMHAQVRINAVAPGAMKTGIGRDLKMPDGVDPALIARYSGFRPAMEPEQVAELVAFVASPRGAGIHGACLSVDQGVTAG
jgi:NAD(P)-dependent dehydrogenase (short-subunit alcohol dehydrogenase family)